MLLVAVALMGQTIGCSDASKPKGDTIPLGASLPFTGNESANGRNFEQAMLLAIEDINNAGGIGGVPLSLSTRDSNSGSTRGLDDLLDLIYNVQVRYLIGPDETELANDVVPDIKSLNILNILPGYAAPSTNRVSTSGAWMRLAPLPEVIAYALAAHALEDGATRVNTLSSSEDYNASVATQFTSSFFTLRDSGSTTPSVTIQTGQSSYAEAIRRVFSYGAERTLLVASPETAATVVTETSISGVAASWYLSPLLNVDVFLLNTPFGSLDGAFGLSPSLSLASECEAVTGTGHQPIQCTQGNATRFSDHFAERWNGARPFPSAYFYYDAVVLLALGMQYSLAKQGTIAPAPTLQKQIRTINTSNNQPAYWYDLTSAMATLATGAPLRYVGAAAEYDFDQYGAAKHRVFDTWCVRNHAFASTGAYFASAK